MNRSFQIFVILCVFCILLVSRAFGMDESQKKTWKGKLRDGTEITEKELRTILERHQKWLNSERKEGERADLSEANLSSANLLEANLSDANLLGANFNNAHLYGANLSKANLWQVSLSEANLSTADLSNARLLYANLSNAELKGTNLSDAELVGSILSNANLFEANLNKADLYTADLSNANLFKANLSNAGLQRSNLSNANLSEANMSEAGLNNAILNRADLSKANLSGARMNEAALFRSDLSKAVLNDAILVGAYLSGAILRGAILQRAKMIKANLLRADMSGADLSKAELNEAVLYKVNLSKAIILGANLSHTDIGGASLNHADLSGANLSKAIITEADITGCDMTDVRGFPLPENPNEVDSSQGIDRSLPIYEPKAGSAPYIPSMIRIPNLEKLSFIDRPHGLMALREGFKKLGYKEKERQVTFASLHTSTKTLLSSNDVIKKTEGLLRYYFFEYTSNWGMSPGRPIFILFGLMGLLSFVYMFFLIGINVKDGIWKVWIKDRVRSDLGEAEPKEPLNCSKAYQIWCYGFYFSILSAFNIGWRELNVGNWIARIQPREYTLRASGWVRMVSGIQSLISVYLLALAVLTYFGRPFDQF